MSISISISIPISISISIYRSICLSMYLYLFICIILCKDDKVNEIFPRNRHTILKIIIKNFKNVYSTGNCLPMAKVDQCS